MTPSQYSLLEPGWELPEPGWDVECPEVLGTTFCTSLGTRYTLILCVILWKIKSLFLLRTVVPDGALFVTHAQMAHTHCPDARGVAGDDAQDSRLAVTHIFGQRPP
jgi:hypothetical protein